MPHSDRVKQKDDGTGAPVDTIELELRLLLVSHPNVCDVGELSGLFLSPGREQRGNRGTTSPEAPRLPPRALRFCFESTKTGIFYRTWDVTILPRKPENLTASVNLIVQLKKLRKPCLNGNLACCICEQLL